MYTLKVENRIGDMLNLSGNSNYTVYKVEGLAPPKATINSSVNAASDGILINSTKLESRNIVIYIAIENEIESNRINLYRWFTSK